MQCPALGHRRIADRADDGRTIGGPYHEVESPRIGEAWRGATIAVVADADGNVVASRIVGGRRPGEDGGSVAHARSQGGLGRQAMESKGQRVLIDVGSSG